MKKLELQVLLLKIVPRICTLRESRQLDDGESLAISVKFLPIWDRQSQGWDDLGKKATLCIW